MLTHPAWRWAAAGGVIAVGSVIGLVSLAPDWLFPVEKARGESPGEARATDESPRAATAGPTLRFRAVPGAARYRVRIIDVTNVSAVHEAESAEPSIELPAELAAAMAPGGRGSLRVDALAETGQTLETWTEAFTLAEASNDTVAATTVGPGPEAPTTPGAPAPSVPD